MCSGEKIFRSIAKYVEPEEFTDPLCRKVAELLTEQLKEGRLNPPSLFQYFTEEEEQQKMGSRYFHFSEDAGCIYAAFREAYGIDLQQIDYMHWWSSGACLTGCRMVQRLNNGLCIVRLILEQSGIRTNVNGSRRSRELLR